jgi:hypothetical protein
MYSATRVKGLLCLFSFSFFLFGVVSVLQVMFLELTSVFASYLSRLSGASSRDLVEVNYLTCFSEVPPPTLSSYVPSGPSNLGQVERSSLRVPACEEFEREPSGVASEVGRRIA